MFARVLVLGMALLVPATSGDSCKPQVIDPAVARDLAAQSVQRKQQCPHAVNVPDLCMAVSEKLSQHTERPWTRYAYQVKIYDGACVAAGDSEEMIRGKVQAFWNQYHPQLTCTQLAFTLRDGDLLKLAVERQSEDFVEEAILDWQVGLNHIGSDQRTVLDFIEAERKRAEGTTRARMFKRYFELFRENGAKFRHEL